MNRYIIDGEGFIVVETKYGSIVIEQSTYETSIKLVPNLSFMKNPSHIEDSDSDIRHTNLLRMVSENIPEDY